MKQDYVIYKGKRYNSGDTIDITWCTHGYKFPQNYKGIFIDCDEEKNEYNFTVDGQMYCFNRICFFRIIRDVVDVNKNEYCIDYAPKKKTFEDELNIDGMLNAWIWYIFIMGVAIIFKDCLGIWAITSIIFFNYRNKKLKERGFKK